MEPILISLGSWLALKIADKGFDSIYSGLFDSKEIDKFFNDCIRETSKELQNEYPDVLDGNIEYFFKKEETFVELVRILFAKSKFDATSLEAIFDTSTLPSNFLFRFVTSLKDKLSYNIKLSTLFSNNEIFLLLTDLKSNTDQIINSTNLTYEEIISLRDLIKKRFGESISFSGFLDLYSKNAIQNLSQVNFIGLGVDISIRRKRKNLQDIFVKPTLEKLIRNSKSHENSSESALVEDFDFDSIENSILYDEILNYHNKIVILGNPGSGKSVLVKSIICDILQLNYLDIFESENLPTVPFRIELRKFLSFKKQGRGNIISYLSYILDDEYNIYGISEEMLDNILKKNKCIFFFDGLDEIFRIEDKISVKNDIENFHNTYNKINSVTTSRIIGYDEAKLHDESFKELLISNFDDEQVKEYIQKWYDKEEDNHEIRQKEIQGFLSKKDEIDNELISNPLLLSLIVILYRNILKLPESKLEIYQSCTKTLVDKWDASKELQIDLDPEILKIKDKILADLAYWQYEELSKDNSSISYKNARNQVHKTISEKLLNDELLNIEDLSEKFMVYAQKRSIYFDNNFTHKTFLEFYTAYWIYSNIEKKHNITVRNEIISKYISNSFWHIVLELLLNMIDKDQADSEIMDGLIEIQINRSSDSLLFILSTIPSFKNISKSIFKKSIDSTISYLSSMENTKLSNNIFGEPVYENQLYESLKRVHLNYSNLLAIFQEYIQNTIDKGIDDKVKTEVFILFMEFFHDNKNENIFEFNTNGIFNYLEMKNEYLFLLKTYFYSYNNDHQYLSFIVTFYKRYGIERIKNLYSAHYEKFQLISPIAYFLNRQFYPHHMVDIEKNFEYLSSIGILKSDIISMLTDIRIFYRYSQDTALKILDLWNTSNDEELRKISLLYLFNNADMRASSDGHLDLKTNIEGKRDYKFLASLMEVKNRATRNRMISSFIPS